MGPSERAQRFLVSGSYPPAIGGNKQITSPPLTSVAIPNGNCPQPLPLRVAITSGLGNESAYRLSSHAATSRKVAPGRKPTVSDLCPVRSLKVDKYLSWTDTLLLIATSGRHTYRTPKGVSHRYQALTAPNVNPR